MEKLIGKIGVDAGMCWVGDPSYILPDDASERPGLWKKLTALISNKSFASIGYKAGAEGTGTYPNDTKIINDSKRVYINKPIIQEKRYNEKTRELEVVEKQLYPNEARLKNLTYRTDINADIFVKLYYFKLELANSQFTRFQKFSIYFGLPFL